MYRIKRTQRIITGIVLASFVVATVGVTGLIPQTARAIPVEDPVVGANTALIAAQGVQKEVKLTWSQGLWASAIIGVVNAANLVAQQFAYDLAVGLASGAAGQNPLAFLSSPGDYFTATAFDAAGEFIGSLRGPWEELGLNLCSPRIPDIGLAIALGLAERFQRPVPKCNFANTLNNWANVVREAQDPQALLKHVSLAFDPSQTDFGQASRANQAFQLNIERTRIGEEVKRLEGGGILPKVDLISGTVATPAEVIGENFRTLASHGKGVAEPLKPGEVLGAVGGGDVWLAVGATALNTFANTLVSRLVKLGLQGIFGPSSTELPDLTKLVGGSPTGNRGGAGVRASAAAVGLLATSIKTTEGNLEYVTQLGTCATTPEGAGQFNCTIDQQFMIALQQGVSGQPMTVQQAIDGNYLDRAKPFGFSNVSGDASIEPNPSEGYAYSSMKKLRLLRVVPLGWEMAAQKIKSSGEVKTLGDVIDGWHKTGPDGACGTTDDESPFCALVDPNWVLKAPVAQCGAQVFGARLDASHSGRQEECADIRHCVSESENGQCRAYGYCTRERNAWRFDGDSCDPQYASCDTFKQSDVRAGAAQEFSFLESTVDFGSCNAENTGCTAYIAGKSRGADGAFAWNPSSARLHLDSDAPTCTDDAAGCTELLDPESVHENLVLNPGFENDDAIPGVPDFWNGVPVGAWSSDGTQGSEGQGALRLSDAVLIDQRVPVEARRVYTISVASKGSGTAVVNMGATNSALASFPFIVSDVIATDAECVVGAFGPETVLRLRITPSTGSGGSTSTYARRSCTFMMPAGATRLSVRLVRASGTTDNVWIDALQLEEGAAATEYHERYVGDVSKSYFRLPPAYLSCTGEEGQPVECEGTYAKLCRAEEVGCERYTPKAGAPGAGDPAIPGIVSAGDRCPASCVGYATYIKQSSRFEPQFTAVALGSAWPASAPEEGLYAIIPKNARSCSAEVSGCDEFTNLATEQREYYSNLRACQKPGTDSHTFFTWEGSDTSGYQLKSWNVKRSDVATTAAAAAIPVGTCAAVAGAPADAPKYCGNVTTVSLCTTDADCTTDIVTAATAFPPCTNYQVTTGTAGIQVTCVDNETISGITYEQARCTKADAGRNPNCRGFYDEKGNIFYRLMSRTIVSTDECQSFRWTGFPQPSFPEVVPMTGESQGALRTRLEQTACVASHGSWDATTNQCVYVGAPSLSKTCSAELSGCRGFKGNSASNIENVFHDQFEAGGIAGWASYSAPGSATVTSSSESLVVGEHSLKVRGASSTEGVARALVTSATPPAALLTAQGTYFVSFNIKGTLGRRVESLFKKGTAEDVFGSITITPEWQHVELGPVTLGHITDNLNDTKLVLRVVGGTGDATFFVDDMVLKRTQDVVYLVKNANLWNIPPECDTPARGAMVGCRAYTDRAGQEQDLKSFSSLCRARSVGCTARIDTKNSSNPWAETFNGLNSGICRGTGDCRIDTTGDGIIDSSDTVVCTVAAGETSCSYGPGVGTTSSNIARDDVTVNADTRSYIVIDPVNRPEFACKESQKGCQQVATRNTDGTFNEVALRNDPDRYGSDLCKLEAEGCASWKRTDQSLTYFKAPAENFCEYRTNVKIGSTPYSGWFKKGPQKLGAGMGSTKERCEGYGTWSLTSPAGCIGPNGTTLCSEGGTLDGQPCVRRYCEDGIGGTWDGNIPNDTGTPGACMSVMPCYGTLTIAGSPPILTLFTPSSSGPLSPYLVSGNAFGIWKNADARYRARVGLCPKAQSTCAEFIDPTDTAQNPAGYAYYRKDNERLATARQDCSGQDGLQVSRNAGCVLFNNTDDPRALYNADDTYAQSDAQAGAFVPPVDGGGRNNTNVLLKVMRDRTCAEWLQCESASFVWDEQAQELKTVCNRLGRCAGLPSYISGNETLSCDDPISIPVLDLPPPTAVSRATQCNVAGGVWQASAEICQLQRIGAGTYQDRDTRFSAREFSGYTIPDMYPPERLSEFNFGTIDNPAYRLAHVQGSCDSRSDCPPNAIDTGYACINRRCATGPLGGSFLTDTNCTINSDCTSGQCIQPTGTTLVADRKCLSTSRAPECRGFPEKSSPFPNTAGAQGTRDSRTFANVPKCQDRQGTVASTQDVLRCGCNYNAVSYGGEKRYYNADEEDIPGEVCRDGSCVQKSGEVNAVGWQGYCLDEDPTRPIYNNQGQHACLAWWPVDRIAAAPDIANQYADAGYQIPATGGQYWCLHGDSVSELTLVTSARIETTDEDQARILTIEVPESFDFRKYDIKSFSVNISADWSWLPWFWEAVPRGNYIIEADQRTNGDEHIDALVPPSGFSESPNFQAYDTSADPEQEWWWWAADDNASGLDSDSVSGAARATGENLDSASLRRVVDKLKEYSLGSPDRTVSCEGNVVPWDDPSSDDYDMAAVMLRFNPDNQKLRYIRLAYCSTGCGAGESSCDGGEGMLMTVRIRLQPHCSLIGRIDPLRSAPWTDRLWEGTTYTGIPFDAGNYRYDKQYMPYGSSPSHTAPPTSGEKHAWFLNHNRMESNADILAKAQFAGWPYSCNTSSSLRESFSNAAGGTCVGADIGNNACDVSFTVHATNTGISGSLSYSASLPGLHGYRGSFYAPGPSDASLARGNFYYSIGVDSAGEDGTSNTSTLCNALGGDCAQTHLKRCTVNTTLFDPEGNPITAGPVAPLADTDPSSALNTTYSDTPTGGSAKFSNLFARSYLSYFWNGAQKNYNKLTEEIVPGINNLLHYDIRGLDPSTPFVYGADVVTNSDSPLQLFVADGIVVNGQYGQGSIVKCGGGIECGEGFLNAVLSFYGWADNDHMPIRYVAIDWDDGRTTGIDGRFRNHMKECADGPDHPAGFGTQKNISCEERPFTFSNMYKCERGIGPNWKGTTGANQCPSAEFRNQYGGCCVFAPAVQIRDNWGYCNGACGISGDGDRRCFGDVCNESPRQNGNAFIGPWTEFFGKIIVAPRE